MGDENADEMPDQGVEDVLRNLPRSEESLAQVAAWLKGLNQEIQGPTPPEGSVTPDTEAEDEIASDTGEDNPVIDQEESEGTTVPLMARADSLS